MLIALAAMLISMMSGGPTSPYIVEDADKIILSSITEKTTKTEAKELLKVYEKEWKSSQKWQKKHRKAFKKSLADREVSNDQLEKSMEEFQQSRESVDDMLIDARLKLLAFLSDEEWKTILDEIESTTAKKGEKMEKSSYKRQLKLDEGMIKFKASASKYFEEASEKQAVEESIDRFMDQIADIMYSNQDRLLSTLETVKDKEANLEEMKQTSEVYHGFQRELNGSFLDLRSDFMKMSDDKQWAKLAKLLQSMM